MRVLSANELVVVAGGDRLGGEAAGEAVGTQILWPLLSITFA